MLWVGCETPHVVGQQPQLDPAFRPLAWQVHLESPTLDLVLAGTAEPGAATPADALRGGHHATSFECCRCHFGEFGSTHRMKRGRGAEEFVDVAGRIQEQQLERLPIRVRDVHFPSWPIDDRGQRPVRVLTSKREIDYNPSIEAVIEFATTVR